VSDEVTREDEKGEAKAGVPVPLAAFLSAFLFMLLSAVDVPASRLCVLLI